MYERTGEKLAPLNVNRIFLYQQLKQACWCILWLFAQGLSTHQDQYKFWAICVYSREKKGSTRFTTCNQMQMGPWSLGEGSLYDGKYRFFLFKMMPAAGLPIVVMIAHSADPAWSGEALSFKSGTAVWHSWFLLTETLPCLPACLRVKRLLGLFHLSCWFIQCQGNRSIWSSEAFPKPFRCSARVAVFQARCSELIQIDWTSFWDRWQHYFGCSSSPGCVRINGKAIFCARGRADLTSYRTGE